jgi:hypothetical protein
MGCLERGLKLSCVLVDDLRELGHGVKGAIFAPPGDIGDAFAVDGQPKSGTDYEGHGFMPSV